MRNSTEHIKIPTYCTDKKQLFQITESIVNGKKVVKSIPLKAYQSIQHPSNYGAA